mmetsp:Transcript_24134/g.36189  ORF Transcript_24134/g.36189 Transcript_24134/m.36189 type:complete len:591 (-) Transcript_24134:337-2109(-)|eukprot:CAMPEP_0167759824 /NCGR_PEP_ID=MMETSP0110_2-20121227/11238_1 /TAXON_ID=629695 /ORGANISM="Gymnochlora sp., Strain CCMP2014" /LENGTH=590 /DNA_ID=CAMNT_0007646253 /DNA_START=84 /DNA_END=1856 /DNA_ORIENTATION=+
MTEEADGSGVLENENLQAFPVNSNVELLIVKGEHKGQWIEALVNSVLKKRYTVTVPATPLSIKAGFANRTIANVHASCLRKLEISPHSGSGDPTDRVTTSASEEERKKQEKAYKLSDDSKDVDLPRVVSYQNKTILKLRQDKSTLKTIVENLKTQINELKLQKELLISKDVELSPATKSRSERTNDTNKLEQKHIKDKKIGSLQLRVEALTAQNKRLNDALVRERASAAPVHKLYQEALRLYRGGSEKRNPRGAFQLAIRAANRGHARAQCLIGLCYQNGEGIEKAPSKAFAFFLLAAMQGYALAQYNLAWCFRDGDGVSRDKYEAFNWFMKSARQGKAGAQYSLGYCFRTGEGTPRNLNQAFFWFSRAAEQGHVLAQNSMGICYEYGEGTQRDDSKAFAFYKRASESGDPQALYNLGLCYHYGRGVAASRKRAMECFTLAAKQDNQDAIEALRKLSMLSELERKYERSSTRTNSTVSNKSMPSIVEEKNSVTTSDSSISRRRQNSGEMQKFRPWVKRLAQRVSSTHGYSVRSRKDVHGLLVRRDSSTSDLSAVTSASNTRPSSRSPGLLGRTSSFSALSSRLSQTRSKA